MVYYTFACPSCGDFTEWHSSMQGNKELSICPACEGESTRVFTPPMLSKMDSRLKQKVEQGMEPKIMKGDAFAKTPTKKRSSQNLRPWQAARLD